MSIDEIIERYPEANFLKADGFDAAILGVIEDINKPPRLVYSRSRIIQILEASDNLTREEAIEYYEFNIAGAYVGENTPAYLDDDFFYELK